MSNTKRKAIVFDLDDGKISKFAKPSAGRTANVQFISGRRDEKEEEESNSTWLPLMQPEILSVPFMLETLDKYKVEVSSQVRSTRGEVQKLFLAHITPKPQRSHRSTRLGRVMSRQQKLCTTHHEPDWHKLIKNSQNLQSSWASQPPSSTPPSATDRLKPPVQSCINTARKTIKLGGSKKDTGSLPINDTALNDKMLNKIDTLLKFPTNPTKSSSNSLSLENSGGDGGGRKRVISVKPNSNNVKKLKTAESASVTTSNEERTSSTPKKKHAAVSWP